MNIFTKLAVPALGCAIGIAAAVATAGAGGPAAILACGPVLAKIISIAMDQFPAYAEAITPPKFEEDTEMQKAMVDDLEYVRKRAIRAFSSFDEAAGSDLEREDHDAPLALPPPTGRALAHASVDAHGELLDVGFEGVSDFERGEVVYAAWRASADSQLGWDKILPGIVLPQQPSAPVADGPVYEHDLERRQKGAYASIGDAGQSAYDFSPVTRQILKQVTCGVGALTNYLDKFYAEVLSRPTEKEETDRATTEMETHELLQKRAPPPAAAHPAMHPYLLPAPRTLARPRA